MNKQQPNRSGWEKHFARILGRPPRTGPVKFTDPNDDRFQELFQSFGPPESESTKEGLLLFWNFVWMEDEDQEERFTVYAKLGAGEKLTKHTEFYSTASTNAEGFRDWFMEKMLDTDDSEITPAFLLFGMDSVISRFSQGDSPLDRGDDELRSAAKGEKQ
jgi:hypothetical protein